MGSHPKSSPMKIGSLCSGYGGLDMALGAVPVWHSEIDPDASVVLQTHHPEVPNLGDFRSQQPEPVDILTAGFPCQPVSNAGNRKGLEDDRWLWDDIAAFVSRMEPQPRYLFLENVAGLLTANNGHAFSRVLHDLDTLGFDAEWTTVRASDIGAPHQRNRWFCLAYTTSIGCERLRGAWEWGTGPPNSSDTPTNTDSSGSQRHRQPVERPRKLAAAKSYPPDLWGNYEPAIHHWAAILGRPAPNPTDPRGRLNPPFVEWMMGLPPGWVTNNNLSRAAQLRILGNGVVPQQATQAIHQLTQRTQVTLETH